MNIPMLIRQVAAPVFFRRSVDDVSQKAGESAAGEYAGKAAGEDHHGLGAGHAEQGLPNGIACAADQQRFTAGNVAFEFAPERRKQKIGGLHGSQRHTKHGIVEVIFLDQRGSDWMRKTSRHKKATNAMKKRNMCRC